MKFIADLHVHSRFSRATAKDLDLENLHAAAQKKGILVVGTGDFTHPGWYSEIKKKLVPAEEGLFKLKDSISHCCDQHIPISCRSEVRFILASEISNIYKKNGRTRKIHNLVFFPDIDSVAKFNQTLERIGNIKSDGRPILGLDAKNLLEIVLETSNQGFLIPAHIWTPWFSILGSRSGFDSIEECFEDYTRYIFAVETGLSSDPAMNWRVSGLDDFTLVSNSDAHSPMKLGREANLLNTDVSYPAIKSAIRSGDPKRFLGTFEFYPQEGKYHLDGHRKCNVRLWPQKTIEKGGICPICKKPLTLGVLYRVEELADRPKGVKPKRSCSYHNIIPLAEILSEILMVSPSSKKLRKYFNNLIQKFGPEFRILHFLEPDVFETSGLPLLGEAIKRMRLGKIDLSPGYDGEFGRISIFNPSERQYILGQKTLFSIPVEFPTPNQKKLADPPLCDEKLSGYPQRISKQEKEMVPSQKINTPAENIFRGNLVNLNPEQRLAVEYTAGPVLIVAGPGTGKTLTLTYRIAYLVSQKQVSPKNILALTFTNFAAQEMQQRLQALLPDTKSFPLTTTFHSLCFQLLKERENKNSAYTIINDYEQNYFFHKALAISRQKGVHIPLKSQIIFDKIVSLKQQMLGPQDNLEKVVDKSEVEIMKILYETYQKLLSNLRHYDYEDLIFNIVKLLENDKESRKKYRDRFQYILVDEYQDLNHGQYRMIKALSPPGKDLFVIGDPDQSIYGFRGSEVRYFKQFLKDYPDAEIIRLKQNYRSTQTILDASFQVISADGRDTNYESRIFSKISDLKKLSIIETVSEKAEAVAIGLYIEKMVGGIGFYSLDFDKVDAVEQSTPRSFSDFAVLCRTRDQLEVIADVFHNAGIPCQVANKEEAFHKQGLAELLSFLKLVEGLGSYPDFERMISFTGFDIGKKAVNKFTNWGLQNGLQLSQALKNIRRDPLGGTGKEVQQKLNEFSAKLSEIRRQMQNINLEKKLKYIVENSVLPPTKERKKNLLSGFNNSISHLRKFNIGHLGFPSLTAFESDTDVYNPQSEKVTLLSMHAAKGLEFPVVFISGCEEGFIPLQRSNGTPEDINEERRLFYVAMTRAQARLFLTYAKKRLLYGKTVKREISPFVKDINKHLKHCETQDIHHNKAERALQLKLF